MYKKVVTETKEQSGVGAHLSRSPIIAVSSSKAYWIVIIGLADTKNRGL